MMICSLADCLAGPNALRLFLPEQAEMRCRRSGGLGLIVVDQDFLSRALVNDTPHGDGRYFQLTLSALLFGKPSGIAALPVGSLVGDLGATGGVSVDDDRLDGRDVWPVGRRIHLHRRHACR